MAIWFSPFSMDESHEIEVKDFTIVEGMYIKTEKGLYIAAEIWKDTPANRALITQIKEIMRELRIIENRMKGQVYQLLNQKEK